MEVIEVVEREVEVIEVIERGPAGPTGATGPQGPAGAGGVTSVTGTAPIVSSGGTTPAISVTVGTGANTVAAGNDSRIANITANSITTAQGANSGGAGGTITMRGGVTGSNGAGGNAGSINLRGSDDRDEGAFNGGSIDLSALNGTGGNITSTGNSEFAGGSLNMSGGGQGAGGSINTSNAGGSINTSAEGGAINTTSGGGTINTSSGGGSINTSNDGGSINTSGLEGYVGGDINTSASGDAAGGSIDTSVGGGSINTRGTGSIGLGVSGTRTTLTGTATADRAISLPNASGTIARTEDFAAPPAIGNTTRNSGAFTTLSAAPTSGSALTLTGGTVTASAPLISATQTWNDGAVTFTGLAATITNTASATSSLVARLTVGSTNVFEVDGRGFTKVRKVATSTEFVSVFEVLRGTTSVVRLRDDGDISGSAFAVGTGGNVIINTSGVGIQSTARFGISSSAAASTTDCDLNRDAADTFAQRRGTNAQTFRLYSTFTSTTSFERLNIAAQTGGSFIIGTEKGSAGGAARALEFQTDGVTRMTVATAGAVSTSGNFSCVDLTCSTLTVTSGSVTAAATGAIRWSGRARFNSPADSIVTIVNAANTDFNRLQFGGTDASFPALKRSSTALQVRLADDSAFAPFACAGLTLNGDLTASTRNIVTDTTTGTKIGTGTTQLLGFWNATPAVQPAAVADATDAATTQARLNDLLARLRTIGIIAT